MSPDRLPLVVLEGPGASPDPDLRRLLAAGFWIIPGWRRQAPPGRRVVRSGVVATAADAADAVLAALEGSGLVIVATADRVTTDHLVEDLRRLGRVDHRRMEEERPDTSRTTLSAEARAILGMLAEGFSLGEAASRLGLARRTAVRRLAQARSALGVERTSEAIARARRLGWLELPPR